MDFVTCGDHVGAVVGHLIPCLSVCLLLLLLGEMGMPPSWANALIAVCVLSVVVYYWKTERMETETIEKPQDASDCTDNNCKIDDDVLIETAESTKECGYYSEAYYDPLEDNCCVSESQELLKKSIHYVKTHEWPGYLKEMNRSNSNAEKTYSKMISGLKQLRNCTWEPIVPFTVNDIMRKEISFCEYLQTYFTTIRRRRHGRRDLVRRVPFEKKFSKLEFFHPLRMKLSFNPPPLRDYGVHKFHHELFGKPDWTGLEERSGSDTPCKTDNVEYSYPCRVSSASSRLCQICRQSSGSNCSNDPPCFIAQYSSISCSGDCACYSEVTERYCQTIPRNVKIPYSCSRPSASDTLRRNVRDPESGILEEGMPQLTFDALYEPSDIISTCKAADVSKDGNNLVLNLPICCQCNCI